MKQGQNIRARSGALRIQYDPAWSPSRPFCTFFGGTARGTFASVEQAMADLGGLNARWTDWT